MADMTTTETSVHKELKSSQIKSSEEGVTNVKDAVMGFTNPFTIENKKELIVCPRVCLLAVMFQVTYYRQKNKDNLQ